MAMADDSVAPAAEASLSVPEDAGKPAVSEETEEKPLPTPPAAAAAAAAAATEAAPGEEAAKAGAATEASEEAAAAAEAEAEAEPKAPEPVAAATEAPAVEAPEAPAPAEVPNAAGPDESNASPMAQHFSMADDSDEEVQQVGSRGSEEANDSFMGLSSGPAKAAAAAGASPAAAREAPPVPSAEAWLTDTEPIPTEVGSSTGSGAAPAAPEADLQSLAAGVREKFQFMSKEDQQMLCRRHCELAQKREEAVLRQLQTTIDRYTRALEVSRAVVRAIEKGATADENLAARLATGPQPGLTPELVEAYEARIRVLQEAMLAIRSEALVVLPRLTPLETAKGVAAAGVARTVAGFNKLKDGAGIAPALDSAQGFFSNFRTRWRTATGGSSQNATTPPAAAAGAGAAIGGGAGATSDFPEAGMAAPISTYQPPLFAPAPRDIQQPPEAAIAGSDEIAY